jgi:hypothetical protein
MVVIFMAGMPSIVMLTCAQQQSSLTTMLLEYVTSGQPTVLPVIE